MLMAGVILISFALLGGAFVTLSYQYAVQEKRDSLGDNAKYIAQSFMRSLSTASTTLGSRTITPSTSTLWPRSPTLMSLSPRPTA